MSVPPKVRDALNKQINHELYSAYLYLGMAAYFEGKSLKGFSHWMRKQSQEELHHAMRIYDHLLDRNAEVSFSAVNVPLTAWKSPLAACEAALKHEESVTKLIHGLVETARRENDHATEVFLHWFVDEQVEEEDSASELVDKVALVGDSGHGLLLLDEELKKRE